MYAMFSYLLWILLIFFRFTVHGCDVHGTISVGTRSATGLRLVPYFVIYRPHIPANFDNSGDIQLHWNRLLLHRNNTSNYRSWWYSVLCTAGDFIKWTDSYPRYLSVCVLDNDEICVRGADCPFCKFPHAEFELIGKVENWIGGPGGGGSQTFVFHVFAVDSLGSCYLLRLPLRAQRHRYPLFKFGVICRRPPQHQVHQVVPTHRQQRPAPQLQLLLSLPPLTLAVWREVRLAVSLVELLEDSHYLQSHSSTTFVVIGEEIASIFLQFSLLRWEKPMRRICMGILL